MGFMARNSYLTGTWKEKQAWKGVRMENELPRLSTWCVRVLIPLPLTGINQMSAWMGYCVMQSFHSMLQLEPNLALSSVLFWQGLQNAVLSKLKLDSDR